MNKTKCVLNTYPTFSEIVKNPKYKMNKIVPPVVYIAMRSEDKNHSQYVADVVNHMCNKMFNLPFFKTRWFQPTQDGYCFDTNKFIGGYAEVYDSRERIHKVDYETFLKLTLVMYMSFLGIELTKEQYESYLDFKCSSFEVMSILD